ncbi:MAG: hypothetical protein QXY45_00965 [Candidatus Aenigmatarchaeota archaeon]
MKGLANWIMVIGGLIIGITVFYAGVSLLVKQMRMAQVQTVLEEVQDFHNQLSAVCRMGLGHKKSYTISLPDNVRAVYVANKSYELPPDKVSVMISNRVMSVGNYTCIQFFNNNLPVCEYIGCYANFTYIGSPSMKPSLQTLLASIRGNYPVYVYSVNIEKIGPYFLDVISEPKP